MLLPRPTGEPARSASRALISIAVPLASFLSFSIQPAIGKMLLPSQGGGAATWLGTMVFFQLALMIGYAVAAWLSRRPMRFQFGVIIIIAILANIITFLPPPVLPSSGSIFEMVGSLSLALLPAMILLFCAPSLLHGWWGDAAIPYHVYALSNLGSLCALLLYPIGIEPSIGLARQALLWRLLLLVLTLIIAAAIYLISPLTTLNSSHAPAEKISTRRILNWITLSSLTCVVMLAATGHIIAEIGSSPIAWVTTFGIYLFSYALVFSGRWKSSLNVPCLCWLAISLFGFIVTKGIMPSATVGPALYWLFSLTASACILGNSLLHASRPDAAFGVYYLYIAIGGVLGGLFVSLVAPQIFTHQIEFLLAAGILLTIGLCTIKCEWSISSILVHFVAIFSAILAIGWKEVRDTAGADKVYYYRNIYGCSYIRKEGNGGVVLSNETTTHGSQLTATPESRRRPTLYYSESTGVGRTIEKLQASRPSVHIGVIGLGAGTLAAYVRSADQIKFWDIDPKAAILAHEFFSYITDAKGHVDIIQKDGRIGLMQCTDDFDLIVIDAFSGDSIPTHLLTREALAIYERRLAVRHGLLLVHASNRYSRVFPVLAATARAQGLVPINIVTRISSSTPTRDWDPVLTQYILLCKPEQVADVQPWFPDQEDDGRVKREVAVDPPPAKRDPGAWTDDRQSVLDSLQLTLLLNRDD